MTVMGQSQSSDDVTASVVHGQVQRQLSILKRVVITTHESFIESVVQLNKLTSSFTDSHGKQLFFMVKSGTDEHMLWKSTVRVQCMKVNTRSNHIESSRILNMRQYYALNQEIMDKATMSALQPQDSSTEIGQPVDEVFMASMIFNGVDNAGIVDEENECCICMENKAQIILPCEHQFCETCIDSWNVSHCTCPLCRANVKTSDESWVLTDKPNNEEYATEVKGYLVSLADRTGSDDE